MNWIYKHYERMAFDYKYRIIARSIVVVSAIILINILLKFFSYNDVIYNAQIMAIDHEKTYVSIIDDGKDIGKKDASQELICVDRLVTDYIGKEIEIGFLINGDVGREGIDIIFPELLIFLVYELIRFVIDYIHFYKERRLNNENYIILFKKKKGIR